MVSDFFFSCWNSGDPVAHNGTHKERRLAKYQKHDHHDTTKRITTTKHDQRYHKKSNQLQEEESLCGTGDSPEIF
jgi:hypothetical protein